MIVTRKIDFLFFCCLFIISCSVISACHSRRLASQSGYDTDHLEPASIIVLPLQEAELRTRYSSLLGIGPEQLHDIRIYFFIDQWLGTPYLNGGTTHMGIDCSAFSQGLYREVIGMSIPRISSQQGDLVHDKPKDSLEEGDLVFFSSGHNHIDHVGVYLGNGKFIHASTSKGVIISDLNQNWYQKNYVKGGSVK